MVIDWKNIGQPLFDQIVETIAHHELSPIGLVTAIDGKGGDFGRDIEVKDHDDLKIVLQLKYFPEGISGPYVRRRNQVRRSWESLSGSSSKKKKGPTWPKGKPERWIFVLPCKLDDSGRDYLVKLLRNSGVHLDIWDKVWLDSWLANNPRIENYFLKDLLKESAIIYGQEKAIPLNGLSDFDGRLKGLNEVGGTLDPHWDVDFSVVGDQRSYSIRPKHSGAAQASPIGISLGLSFGPEHSEVREAFERVVGFGTLESVALAPEIVKESKITGPEWLPPMSAVEGMRISSAPESQRKLSKMRLHFSDGKSPSFVNFDSTDVIFGKGTEQRGSFTAKFFRIFTVSLLVDFSTKSQTFEYQVSFKGATVPEATRAAKLIQALRKAGQIEILIDGLLLGVAQLQDSEIETEMKWWIESIEDFEVVERLTGTFAELPESMTGYDRVSLRAVRLLLEGKCTYMPGASSVDMTLNGLDSPEIRALTDGKPAALQAQKPITEIEIAGEKIPLGDVIWWHPVARMSNTVEVLEALDSGDSSGTKVVMSSGDGTPYRVVLASSVDENGDIPPTVPWGLAGFADPVVEI